jgi:hypothetical protein
LLPTVAMAMTVTLLADFAFASVQLGESALQHLAHVGLLPGAIGLLVATLLAGAVSCSSAPLRTWRGRAATLVLVVVGGLAAQELTALGLGAEHFGGLRDAVMHASDLALPVAGVCAAVGAIGLGVRRAAAPLGRAIVTLVWFRPAAPRLPQGSAGSASRVRTGLRLLRHLLGPAPPHPAR